MTTTAQQVHQPRTVRDALRLMRDAGPLTPIAGCTDLLVQVHFGQPVGSSFLDLSRLGTLTKISESGENLVIGASATYTSIIKSRLVRRRLLMLVAASREIGGPQIQNRGTIGGNVANGSPAGDSLPVLSAVDATVVLASVDGERRVPFGEFFTGYRANVRKPDELIVAIEIPPVEGRQWFRKVGTRAAQAISKVMMAGVRSTNPRIAIGSVAPTVIRARQTEAALARGGTIAEARAALDRDIAPIDDVRSTAQYRRAVAGNLLEQFWAETSGT